MSTLARLWNRFTRGRQSTQQERRRTVPRFEELEERCVPTLLGQQLFPDDNPWNQVISNAPVASNSDAIIANIIAKSGGVDGRLHPDFGQDDRIHTDLYGIPINVVHGNSMAWTPVKIDAYP